MDRCLCCLAGPTCPRHEVRSDPAGRQAFCISVGMAHGLQPSEDPVLWDMGAPFPQALGMVPLLRSQRLQSSEACRVSFCCSGPAPLACAPGRRRRAGVATTAAAVVGLHRRCCHCSRVWMAAVRWPPALAEVECPSNHGSRGTERQGFCRSPRCGPAQGGVTQMQRKILVYLSPGAATGGLR